jgi:peptidyl-prolyl cis-trans isomerase B (cyclophilin B)
MIRLRAAAPLAALALLLAGCGSGSESDPGTDAGACAYPSSPVPAAKEVDPPPTTPDPAIPDSVVISTSSGDIPITFEADTAPCTVNSFVSLAQQGYFDDTECHRLSTTGYYILQCGDPSGTSSGGPGYSFADELVADDPRLEPCSGEGDQRTCTYNTGTIAMANSGADTNGSQFFLVYGNSVFPPNYTIFGTFDAAGLKTLKAIGAKGLRDPGATDGVPRDPVLITGVK